jgi:hypothetical protein
MSLFWNYFIFFLNAINFKTKYDIFWMIILESMLQINDSERGVFEWKCK